MTFARAPRRLPLAAALAAAVALAACAQPPVPKDAFYRLDVPAPEVTARAPLFDGKAEVRPLNADGVLRQRAVAYVGGEGSDALQEYSYHFWAEPPADLVQRELVDHLRAAGLFETVVTPELRVRTDFEIQGRLARFEQVLADGPPRFMAEVELAATRKRGLDLILMKTYRVEEPAGGPSVEAAADAARRALATIFARFEDDLADVARR